MIRTRTLWADSAAVDVLLFLAPVLLVPIPHLLHVDQGLPVLALAAGVKFAFDLPHLASCWTRTLLDPSFRREHPVQVYGAVPLILAATLVLGAAARLDVLIAGLFFLAVPHGYLQVANLLACYRRRAGEGEPPWRAVSETAALVLIPTALLLERLSGDLGKTILDVEIPHAWILPWMAPLSWALSALALSAALIFEARARRRGEPLNPAKWAFGAGVAGGYWLLSKIPSLELATLGYLCWHSAQYAALTYRVNRKRSREVKSHSPLLGSLFQPGSGGYYALAVFFHGVLVYLAIAALARLTPAAANAQILWAVAVLYALSFTHFLLDVTLMVVPRYSLVPATRKD